MKQFLLPITFLCPFQDGSQVLCILCGKQNSPYHSQILAGVAFKRSCAPYCAAERSAHFNKLVPKDQGCQLLTGLSALLQHNYVSALEWEVQREQKH